MQSKLTSVAVGVALVLGVVGLFVGDTTNPVVERTIEKLGAAAGPEFSNRVVAKNGITAGGGCYSTTTTGVLQAGILERFNCLYMAAAGAGQEVISMTLPASSTLQNIIPTVGDCADWFIDASQLVAATTTTIVKGTGIDLVGLDATGAGTGADVIDGAEFGRLTLCRERNTDIVGYVTEWIAAD